MSNGDKVWVEAEQDGHGDIVLTLVDVAQRRRVNQQYGSHNVRTTLKQVKNFPQYFVDKLQQGYPVRFKMFQHAFEEMLTGHSISREGRFETPLETDAPVHGDPEFEGLRGDDILDDDDEEEGFEQEELENNAVIQETRGGYELVIDGKLIEKFTSKKHDSPLEAAFRYARLWMNKHKYWPNLYLVNERGNVDLIDHQTGKIIRGWV
jgi:hypothetical protein